MIGKRLVDGCINCYNHRFSDFSENLMINLL